MNRVASFILRLFGRFVGLVAWLFILVGGLFAYWFFYIDDRLLFVVPALAEHVPLERLLTQPEEYDDRWVAVEGRLWNQQRYTATLVPTASGAEHWSTEEFRRLLEEREPGAITSNEKPLPEQHVRLRVPGRGASAIVSLYTRNPVTVMGEFEASGMIDDRPRLHVGGIEEQRGDFWHWFAIVLHALGYLVFIAFGAILLYLRKAVQRRGDFRPPT